MSKGLGGEDMQAHSGDFSSQILFVQSIPMEDPWKTRIWRQLLD